MKQSDPIFEIIFLSDLLRVSSIHSIFEVKKDFYIFGKSKRQALLIIILSWFFRFWKNKIHKNWWFKELGHLFYLATFESEIELFLTVFSFLCIFFRQEGNKADLSICLTCWTKVSHNQKWYFPPLTIGCLYL